MAEATPEDRDRDGGPPPAMGSDTELGRALGRISQGLALLGGGLILALMIVTVLSVAGRYFLDAPIRGDFELTELGLALAVFLFFPYTQITGGNIVAEFFTTRVPERGQKLLEAIHSAIFAVVAGFLCWRLAVGGFEKLETSAVTMMLSLPLWWGYVVAVFGMAMLTIVCAWCAWRFLLGARG